MRTGRSTVAFVAAAAALMLMGNVPDRGDRGALAAAVVRRATAAGDDRPQLRDVSVDRADVWVAGTATALIRVRFRLVGQHDTPTSVVFDGKTPLPRGEYQPDIDLTPRQVSGSDDDAVYEAIGRVNARQAGLHRLSMICDCGDTGAEPQYVFEGADLPPVSFTVHGRRGIHLSVAKAVVPVRATSLPLVLRATDDRGTPVTGLGGDAAAVEWASWCTGRTGREGPRTGPDGRERIEVPLEAWGGIAFLRYPGPAVDGETTWGCYAAVEVRVTFLSSTSASAVGAPRPAGRPRQVRGTVAMAVVDDIDTSGGTVQLQRRAGGHWRIEDTGRVGKGGRFTLHARPPSPGCWTYRVVYRGGGRLILPSTSHSFAVVAR